MAAMMRDSGALPPLAAEHFHRIDLGAGRRASHRHHARRGRDGRRQPAVSGTDVHAIALPGAYRFNARTSGLVFENRNTACAATISAVIVPCDPFSRCVAESVSSDAGTNVSPPMTLLAKAGMLLTLAVPLSMTATTTFWPRFPAACRERHIRKREVVVVVCRLTAVARHRRATRAARAAR